MQVELEKIFILKYLVWSAALNKISLKYLLNDNKIYLTNVSEKYILEIYCLSQSCIIQRGCSTK